MVTITLSSFSQLLDLLKTYLEGYGLKVKKQNGNTLIITKGAKVVKSVCDDSVFLWDDNSVTVVGLYKDKRGYLIDLPFIDLEVRWKYPLYLYENEGNVVFSPFTPSGKI